MKNNNLILNVNNVFNNKNTLIHTSLLIVRFLMENVISLSQWGMTVSIDWGRPWGVQYDMGLQVHQDILEMTILYDKRQKTPSTHILCTYNRIFHFISFLGWLIAKSMVPMYVIWWMYFAICKRFSKLVFLWLS